MAAIWLAEVLRAAGLPVVEEPGWLTRGVGGRFDPIGVLCHHTAGAATGDLPSLRIVRDGRAGLSGPLSQLMLSRSGVFHVVAAGRANHAGAGAASWVPGNDGNRYLVGIEAESCGLCDDWTPAQRVAYPRGVAALCRRMGVGADHVIGHKEWAPRRKVDPAFWDMSQFRATVRAWLAGDATATPAPTPAPAVPDPREDDPAMHIPIAVDAHGEFAEAVCLDAGNSRYVAHASLLCGSTWGSTSMRITALDHQAHVIDSWIKQLGNNQFDSVEIPPSTKILTIEGDVEVPVPAADGSGPRATRPAATVLLKAT